MISFEKFELVDYKELRDDGREDRAVDRKEMPVVREEVEQCDRARLTVRIVVAYRNYGHSFVMGLSDKAH